jgi:stage III sporulation protein AA
MRHDQFALLQEIRLRVNKPIIVYFDNKERFIDKNNLILSNNIHNALIATYEHIKETLEYISKYSLYAYEDEIKNGFITVEGGHRIGLAGKVVIENGRVKTLRNISCINIRVSHEIKGCADNIIPFLLDDKSKVLHTLIISPPKSGKTTLLRDIVRQLSNGTKYIRGVTVGVVDERSEIGGSYRGIPQNDIGVRTDILDGCPKDEGLIMLIRSMAPEVIVVDEIGGKKDIEAIDYALNAGCTIVCTVHGSNLQEIKNKPILKGLIEKNIFKRFVILENKESIGDYKLIYDDSYAVIGILAP